MSVAPQSPKAGVRADERASAPRAEIAVLEHLTGPSRGRITWLSGMALEISLTPGRFLRISEPCPGETRSDLIARLLRVGNSYEIEAREGSPIWVNGVGVSTRELKNSDIIEFGQRGPLSRFRLHGGDQPIRTNVGEVLSDAVAYLRVSRRPIIKRVIHAFLQVMRQLTRQTTVLFRFSVVVAILILAALIYQQNQINVLQQQRIETGAIRLEGFAGALARAGEEALTSADLQRLREELGGRVSSNAERLAALEQRSLATRRVIAGSVSSVVFLQGSYGFREASSGLMLRHVVDKDGRPLLSPRGQPLLSLEGDGPIAEREFTGTAFAVDDGEVLVTNRHVALPWEHDADIEALAAHGLEPVMKRFLAYLPGSPTAGQVEFLRASDDADLAILRRTDGDQPLPGLKLAEATPAPGDEVIVMGYPTGLRSMLAQAGEAFVDELQESNDIGFWSVAEHLAEGGHIVPLASRGIVAQATRMAVVFDAETTHGGSGGPVLDMNGGVVAVSSIVLPEYGGSNLGVPIDRVRALLAEAGLR
jgi:serine protease Do